jgi:hypothetical protein
VVKINGVEIEGNVEVVLGEDGKLLINQITDTDSNEPVVEDVAEEEVQEKVQINFQAEPWVAETLDKMYRATKATSANKILKRDFLERVMVKGIESVGFPFNRN